MPDIETEHGIVDISDSGAGIPIVCVHGSFSSSAAWRPLEKALCPPFRMVAPNLWGCGRTSDWPSESAPTIQKQAYLVNRAIDYVGESVHVVGHSHGGIVAMATALAWPSKLKSLALLDPLPANILDVANETEAIERLTLFYDEYVRAFESGDRQAARRVIDFWTGEGTFERLPDKFKRHVTDTTALNLKDWQANWAYEPKARELQELTMPTLIVCGAAGNWVASRIALSLKTLIGKSTYVELREASHLMVSTHPETVARLISDHIEASTRSD